MFYLPFFIDTANRLKRIIPLFVDAVFCRAGFFDQHRSASPEYEPRRRTRAGRLPSAVRHCLRTKPLSFGCHYLSNCFFLLRIPQYLGIMHAKIMRDDPIN